MKKLIIAVLLLQTFAWAAAKKPVPEPVSTVNFRGEYLPVYARPRMIFPKKMTPPHYPEAERNAGQKGLAILTILVGTDGKVLEVEVDSSVPTPAFGIAARAAALQWKYDPLVRNDKATKFLVQMPIAFGGVEGDSGGGSMGGLRPQSQAIIAHL